MKTSRTNITESQEKAYILKLEKIVKRGMKLGIPVTFKKVDEFFETVLIDGKSITRKMMTFEVTGEILKISGFEFVGISEFENDKNIIKLNPFVEVEIPSSLHTQRTCDHCKTNRKRNSLVILRNVETSEIITVGKKCAEDFLGIDPHNIWVFIRDFDASANDINVSYRWHENVELIVAQAIAVIEKYGYTSSQKAADQCVLSTKTIVCDSLLPKKSEDIIPMTDDHFKKASEMIEWFLCSKYSLTDTNYIYNMSVILEDEYVSEKYFGYVVSLPAMYAKEMNSNFDRTAKKVSEHIGKEGDKLEINVEFKSENTVQTMYGIMYISTFADENGNKIVWKTSSMIDCPEGVFKIKCTVKSHDIWNNVKQTNVVRVKLVK